MRCLSFFSRLGCFALACGAMILVLTAAGTPLSADEPGIPPDFGYGSHWHEHAAEAGLVEAQYRLGRIHELGIVGAPDPALARQWYGRAAEQGHPVAQIAPSRALYFRASRRIEPRTRAPPTAATCPPQ